MAVRDHWDLVFPRMLSEIQFMTAGQALAARLVAYAALCLVGYWLISSGMPLQRGIAIGLVVVSPLFGVAMALQLSFVVPTRYGASILALLLYLLALRNAGRGVKAAIVVLSSGLVLVAWNSVQTYLVVNPQ